MRSSTTLILQARAGEGGTGRIGTPARVVHGSLRYVKSGSEDSLGLPRRSGSAGRVLPSAARTPERAARSSCSGPPSPHLPRRESVVISGIVAVLLIGFAVAVLFNAP